MSKKSTHFYSVLLHCFFFCIHSFIHSLTYLLFFLYAHWFFLPKLEWVWAFRYEFGIKMHHCYNFHTCRHLWLVPLYAYLKHCCMKRTIFYIKQNFCLIEWDGWGEERGQLVRDLPLSADLERRGSLCSWSEQFNNLHGGISLQRHRSTEA